VRELTFVDQSIPWLKNQQQTLNKAVIDRLKQIVFPSYFSSLVFLASPSVNSRNSGGFSKNA
jgi:hypothetical protein